MKDYYTLNDIQFGFEKHQHRLHDQVKNLIHHAGFDHLLTLTRSTTT